MPSLPHNVWQAPILVDLFRVAPSMRETERRLHPCPNAIQGGADHGLGTQVANG